MHSVSIQYGSDGPERGTLATHGGDAGCNVGGYRSRRTKPDTLGALHGESVFRPL
jgi:hypothetical protein